MKQIIFPSVLVAFILGSWLTGCESNEDQDGSKQIRIEGALQLKGLNLNELESCSVETACEDSSKTCAYLDNPDAEGAYCVDLSSGCEELFGCSAGACIVAESYPVQIFCAQEE